jgi:hypothetical protein
MARILLQTYDGRHIPVDARDVGGAQLECEHATMQLLEQLAWIIDDADARMARAKRKIRERASRTKHNRKHPPSARARLSHSKFGQ